MAELTITRVLQAPRELVWRCWTDPAELTRWWGPRGISTPLETISIDLRPGGHMSLTMVDDATGTAYPNSGSFVEVEPPSRLVWSDDGFPDGSGKGTVTITFVELAAAQTRVTIHAVADFSDTVRAAAEIGWGTSLDKLAELVSA